MDLDVKKFNSALDVAKERTNIHFELKDKQIDCLKSLVEGKDTVGVLATGYGKSLVYTLLPYIQDSYYGTDLGHHIVLVVSPLVALMEEQSLKINDYGVPAAYLSSESSLTTGW
jgi:superfamily II DNA helicase RecQ